MSNEIAKKSNPFKTLLKIYIVLDLIWATLIATFGATILSQVGSVGGASEVATGTATFLGWIIAFVIAFIQGAIFLGVGTAFVVVGFIVIKALSGNNQTPG